MGEVLLAESTGDKRLDLGKGLVVIKRNLDGANKKAQTAMIREEGRIALRLRHENLVETFGIDAVDEDPILILEYLAGRSMAQVLGTAKRTKQMIPVDVVVKIIHDSACGLHFAHTLRDGSNLLGIVHRDVSPANIFVTFDGKVKVIDFGVAKADDSQIKTTAGVLKGKIGYMAPEHTRALKLDPRADLWSLGVLFWESLLAERLFSNQNPAVTMHKINEAVVEPPSTKRADVPPEVDAIVAKLLAKDREQRYASGAELVRDIENLDLNWAKADLKRFLKRGFPEEYKKGVKEAGQAAKSSTKVPKPKGLILLEDLSDEDHDAATLIADSKDLMAYARELQREERASKEPKSPKEEDRTVARSQESLGIEKADRTDGGDSLLDALEDDGSDDLPEDDKTMVATSLDEIQGNAKDDKPAPTPASKKSSLKETQAVRVRDTRPDGAAASAAKPVRRSATATGWAFSGFGIFALACGFFAMESPEDRRMKPLICAYGEGGEDLITACLDVPNAAKRDLDYEHLELKDQNQTFRLLKGQTLTVKTEAVLSALQDKGLMQRALLPSRKGEKIRAMAGPGFLILALLALSIGIPGLFLRGSLALGLRVLLLAATAALGFIGWSNGIGSWPGSDKMEERQKPLRAAELTPPSAPKPAEAIVPEPEKPTPAVKKRKKKRKK